MSKGIFITFEGGEGCGKSTHIAELKKYFESRGKVCVLTREPGGVALAEKIRDMLLHAKEGKNMSARAEILLFEAARAQHVDELIKPALAEGKVVISDRFYDSTTAYQGVARKLDAQSVELLNQFAVGDTKPDLTLILDLPPSEGLARAKVRDNGDTDRMGSEKIEFYEAVRKAFLALAEREKERFAVIDSSGSKSQTFEQILKAVREKFND